MTTELSLIEAQSFFFKPCLHSFSRNCFFYLNIVQFVGKGAASVSVRCIIMPEMRKRFDVHFTMSQISKVICNLVLCLSLLYLMPELSK